MPNSGLQEQLQRTLGEGYQIDRELPRGGMSRVFVARDRALGREVVVKVLPPEMSGGVSVERFQREIQVAARLQHPHIVPVLSAGESGGMPFLIMPFVRGDSLRSRLQRGGELPVDETIRILRDLATALEHAHAEGIVHRDIKPENILLSGGAAVVTDFGVAKALAAATSVDAGPTAGLTSVGVALGTPTYMAPEQASADPTTDQRADIYAWGVIAYEMLTGAPPFAGRSTQAIIAAHIAEPVQPLESIRPELPQELSNLVMRSLSKRPADRPQTASELVATLDRLTSGKVTAARPGRAGGAGRARWKLIVPTAVAAAALIAVGWSALSRRGSAGVERSDSVRRIAVLPFVNASGSRDEEYFADGMSEELGAALGKVRGVQVTSHTSAFAFRGSEIDPKEVGRKLSVDAVLEGKVRRAGNRLRVTAQLTDVSNGLSLWSDSYERDAKDVFAVQDEIAKAIASALEVRFSNREGTVPRDVQGTSDPQAYDLYLRARYYWNRRGADNLRRAIGFFEGATTRDPNFARAYAGAASAYVLLTEYSDTAPPDSHARAERAADRALALDPTVAEAYLARGLVDVHLWKWDEAGKAYRTALQLDPSSATAHQWLGELFYSLGQADSCIAQMRLARALDPLAPLPATALGYGLYAGRRYQDALRETLRARELAPSLELPHRVLAQIYLQLGDSIHALEAIHNAVRFGPEQSRTLGLLVYVAGSLGHREEALAALRQLQAKHRSPITMLFAYVGLGEREKVLAALQDIITEHDPSLSGYPLLLDPSFDSIRNTETFRRVMTEAGLLKSP